MQQAWTAPRNSQNPDAVGEDVDERIRVTYDTSVGLVSNSGPCVPKRSTLTTPRKACSSFCPKLVTRRSIDQAVVSRCDVAGLEYMSVVA
jgi:hypothetical protein